MKAIPSKPYAVENGPKTAHGRPIENTRMMNQKGAGTDVMYYYEGEVQ